MEESDFFLNIYFHQLAALTLFHNIQNPSFVFIGFHCWWCPQMQYLSADMSELLLKLGIWNNFIMSWVLFLTPQSWVHLRHITRVMNDSKQVVLISVFDHWKPEISFQWEINSETLLCPTMWNSANAGNPSSCRTYFSIIYRNTPWFSWLQEDLMVHNNSQDENISLLAEVWPWSMSRELSFWPYFGTYLQTSIQSLFWLMYFFPFWQVLKKD